MLSLCLERYSRREKLFIRKMCTCAQSCPTLWDPVDCSPLGSSIHGIFQALILERVAISSSRGSSQTRYCTCVPRTAGEFFTTEPSGKLQTLIMRLGVEKPFCNHEIKSMKMKIYLLMIWKEQMEISFTKSFIEPLFKLWLAYFQLSCFLRQTSLYMFKSLLVFRAYCRI